VFGDASEECEKFKMRAKAPPEVEYVSGGIVPLVKSIYLMIPERLCSYYLSS
jgi:hypothetical protein